MRNNLKKTRLFLLIGFCFLAISTAAYGQSSEDCMMCHEDQELEAEDGHLVGINSESLSLSVHDGFDCIDCHTQPGDYEDMPHFDVYRNVSCTECHEDAVDSFTGSFHQVALSHGTPNAPDCINCHSASGDSHLIKPLDLRSAENSCQMCHEAVAKRYDGSVHAVAAAKGKNSPGCVSCHQTHSKAFPPSSGAINNNCTSCHQGEMHNLNENGHGIGESEGGPVSCASCHDVHATHIPTVDITTLQACSDCHPGIKHEFEGSVHEELFANNEMNCLSCHKTHQLDDTTENEVFGCGQCHDKEERDYRQSAHRLARLHGDEVAAKCADCHDGHKVLSSSNPESPVNHYQIPYTCEKCHTDEPVITKDFVRLPISMPNYEHSVHGKGWLEGKPTAVCTDCHGSHLLISASESKSDINQLNIAHTCGQCHEEVSEKYSNSIHGKALAHGISDSPSCTDCHSEHLIQDVNDSDAAVRRSNQADDTCGKCHEDPAMSARYGLPLDVVKNYQDSYHGWANESGGEAAAVCVDCHNVHEIKSVLDPSSSIHADNKVETCGRCHDNTNKIFASSYSHILASEKRMIHDWVRIIYIWAIVVILGGMFIHNLIIMIHEMGKHYKETKKKPAVRRMTKNEVWQHLFLAVSFTGLAITGFALRFPNAWWVTMMTDLGLNEENRRIIHRIFALILVMASFYHIFYLIALKRGRLLLKGLLPGFSDAKEAMQNVGYYLGLRKKPPVFSMYDYTQKAEYWALIWGTVVMSVTGVILMFPDIATSFMPGWVVRVSETVHFYEAILAVAAIIIWHFFFEILLPKEYPMNWSWITGRMPKDVWEHHHGRETEDTGKSPEFLPGEKANSDEN
jgi:cytochrome b subunit of formate dehydrogenase